MHAAALETGDSALPGWLGLLNLALEPELGPGPLDLAKHVVRDAEAVLAKVTVAKDERTAGCIGRLGDRGDGEVECGGRRWVERRERVDALDRHARLDDLDLDRPWGGSTLALLARDRGRVGVGVVVVELVLALLRSGRERDRPGARTLRLCLWLGLG